MKVMLAILISFSALSAIAETGKCEQTALLSILGAVGGEYAAQNNGLSENGTFVTYTASYWADLLSSSPLNSKYEAVTDELETYNVHAMSTGPNSLVGVVNVHAKTENGEVNCIVRSINFNF